MLLLAVAAIAATIYLERSHSNKVLEAMEARHRSELDARIQEAFDCGHQKGILLMVRRRPSAALTNHHYGKRRNHSHVES